MKKKWIISVVLILMLLIIIAVLGHTLNIWDFGFKLASFIGLLAIIPASIWIYKKGINYINSGIYFAGIAFIMYKNLFDKFDFRFFILCVLLLLMAIILPITAKLFKKQ